MPIGVIVNVCSVVMGGLAGSLLGEKVSTGFRQTLTIVFGFCAMTMGITSVILVQNMPAVFFSMILGTALGTLLHLDARVRRGVGTVLKKVHLGEISISICCRQRSYCSAPVGRVFMAR